MLFREEFGLVDGCGDGFASGDAAYVWGRRGKDGGAGTKMGLVDRPWPKARASESVRYKNAGLRRVS